jgi:hypothetical protein
MCNIVPVQQRHARLTNASFNKLFVLCSAGAGGCAVPLSSATSARTLFR